MHDSRQILIYSALLFTWIAWCLWAIDWRRMWPRLAEGAWAPLVLLALLITAVWSWMSPGTQACLGLTLPNFWWQLPGVGLIVGLGLFCGWLQMILHWHPTEVELHPAAAPADDLGHGHGH